MATYQTELANAVASYQTTIANARAGTGSYYSIELGYDGGDNVNNPYDLELLDDSSIKSTYVGADGITPGEFQYNSSPAYFVLSLPIAGS
jgi:hypothetical protein